MVKEKVDKYWSCNALGIKRDGEWKRWTYDQYYEDSRAAAKG